MSWLKKPWFSPREVAKKTEVVATPIGPNSVRYEARTSSTIGFRRKETKSEKKRRARYWEEYYGDNYVDSDFGTKYKPKPAYSWTPTSWSSYSFSSFTVASDNNEGMFVKEPPNYLTPTVEEIKNRSNFWTGEDVKMVKEFARVCYLKMIDDKDFINPDFADKNNGKMDPKIWDEKVQIYSTVYDTFIPGFTPLEQAIACTFKYKDKKASEVASGGAGGGGGLFSFNRSDYGDERLNTQLKMNNFNKRYNLDLLNKVSIIGNMGSQFQVEKETGEKEVANSPYLKRKVMREYEQLRHLEIYQRVMPNFRTKFLTKDLQINVPVQTSERKQKIIMLIDFSGSMDEHKKQTWVNAILMDRFRYVIKGEAELFVSYFVANPEYLHFHHIKDEKDVEKFWKHHSNSPNGNMTNMGRIVNHIANEIKYEKRLCNLDIDLSHERPEILIINDGQDRVGYNAFPYKVNAISLVEFSDELKELCIKSGGKQIQVTSKNKVYAYSSEGREEIKNND